MHLVKFVGRRERALGLEPQRNREAMVEQALLDFIRGSIQSVWALELLILLRKGQACTVDELTRELRASPSLVSANLARLEAAGLVAWDGEGKYCYAPASPTIAALCDRLEVAWGEAPMAMVKIIATTPNDKLTTFANAFRWKGPTE